MLIPFGVFSAGVSGGDSGGGSFDLISTTLLTGSQASVTFDVTGLGSTYKHLQIRYTARADRANTPDAMLVRLNGDSGANYSTHTLQGDGTSVSSSYESGNPNAMDYTFIAGNTATANAFAGGVMDFLDAFSTTKYKTRRVLNATSAGAGSFHPVNLTSSSWRNTAAITSLTFSVRYGAGFLAGSRFSIYGVK